MTVDERLELQEAKVRIQSVGDSLCNRDISFKDTNILILIDICKVMHDIERILDDDLYGRYEERMKYNGQS